MLPCERSDSSMSNKSSRVELGPWSLELASPFSNVKPFCQHSCREREVEDDELHRRRVQRERPRCYNVFLYFTFVDFLSAEVSGDFMFWYILNVIFLLTCFLLENVEHCGGEPEQINTGYMSLMSDATHQLNHPPTYIHLSFTGGFLLCFTCQMRGQMLTCHGTHQDLSLSTVT